MTAREKAQQGLNLLKEAVLEEISSSDRALTNAEIVDRLAIASSFEGANKNYLSWTVLGLLVNSGSIRYQGSRLKRVYFARDDQLNPIE